MGYTCVSDYKGGKQDWMEASLPVVKEEAA